MACVGVCGGGRAGERGGGSACRIDRIRNRSKLSIRSRHRAVRKLAWNRNV